MDFLLITLHFKVEINEKATRQLFVINSGRFNFDFSWEIHNRTKLKGLRVADGEKLVSVTPESGTVPCSTRKRCQLSFCPPGRLSLAGCDLLLKVCSMWSGRFNFMWASSRNCCYPRGKPILIELLFWDLYKFVCLENVTVKRLTTERMFSLTILRSFKIVFLVI